MSGSTASLPEQDSSGERERLGRFSLLGVIGRGASATVYEAMDTRMERPVALKVLSFDPLLSPEQRQRQVERFEREARAVARLSHPNIVSVYDVAEEDGKHFLVMELLSGITLRERIDQGGPIALGEATSIVEQIASALDCTHAEGIVHRDIKPSNVLLLPDGRIKMLDFGIARRGEDATVTHAGMLIGSPAYMSPEQGRGENASPASDIWALGALLYELLTGQSPFGAANVAAVLYKAAYEKPEPLPEDVARAQKVVDHALAKLPEERYASAGAMANALRAAVEFPVDSRIPSADSATKQSLQNAAAGAFISSSRVAEPEPTQQTTAEGTAEAVPLPRSRAADFLVIAAWGAVVLAALIIVTVRMRQATLPAAAVSRAKAMPVPAASPLAAAPIMTPASRPVSIAPTSAPSVQIVERQPALPSPKAVAVLLPASKPQQAPSPTPAKAKIDVKTNSVSMPVSKPKPTPSIKAASTKTARAASTTAAGTAVAPPWDDRIDRLGEPEPEPEKTPPPEHTKPQENREEKPDEGTSEKPLYKPSILLGRWQGNIWKRSAVLNIQSSDDDSFQGTLKLTTENGPVSYSIQGNFSPVTGRLSFWSVGTASEAAAKIDLGQENGRLISSQTMGGVGVDSNRRVYTWSFSR